VHCTGGGEGWSYWQGKAGQARRHWHLPLTSQCGCLTVLLVGRDDTMCGGGGGGGAPRSFVGTFVMNQRSGHGTVTLANDDTCETEWDGNHRRGHARCVYNVRCVGAGGGRGGRKRWEMRCSSCPGPGGRRGVRPRCSTHTPPPAATTTLHQHTHSQPGDRAFFRPWHQCDALHALKRPANGASPCWCALVRWCSAH
jgi:hypothetical protein